MRYPVFYTEKNAEKIRQLSSVQPDGYVKIPESGIEDLSDGFHTYRQLYYQRMILFAALVKAYKNKAWKSYRHEDGEYCFGGGWFVVGIDTPEGDYTYHYENKYWDMFDCKDLPRAPHWDGHTEQDAKTRLMSLEPEQERKKGKWIQRSDTLWYYYCSNCHRVISVASADQMEKFHAFCGTCGADMRENEDAKSNL